MALFDTFGVAARGWSVRRLRDAYAGACIRVRRASDNLEQDIGFVNNYIDTAAIATFCAGTNGFVTTVYGQDATGVNLTQITAANQARICLAGVVDVRGAFAGFSNFDDVDDFMTSTGLAVGAFHSYYTVAFVKDGASTGPKAIVAGLNGSLALRVESQGAGSARISITKSQQAALLTSTTFTAGKLCAIGLTHTSSPSLITVYSDNVSKGSAVSSTYIETTSVGHEPSSANNAEIYDDIIFEVVIYNVDTATNRAAITQNQIDYFVNPVIINPANKNPAFLLMML